MSNLSISRNEAETIVRLLGRAISGTPLTPAEDSLACDIQDRLADELED